MLQKSNSLSAPLKWLAGSTLLLSMIVAAQGESPSPAASSCGTEQMLRLADHGTVNVDLSTYTASGASPRGVNGTLDTCQFEARNDNFLKSTASARDVFFGGTRLGAFALGEVDTQVNRIQGGFYSYLDSVHQQRAIIIQPSGSFFTPGYLVLRVQHAGESMIDQLRVNFRQYQLNNAPRSSQLRLAWVLDDHLVEDGSYTEIFADQDVEEAQPDAQFEPFCESELLSGINLMPGQTLFLRWTFDDHQGQGTRDEIGVGSITVTTDLSNRRCAGDPDGSGSPTVSVTDLLMPMATSTVVEEVPATVHPTMMESNNASSPATASTESMSVATTVIPSSSFNSDVVSTTPMNPAISTSTGVASTSTSGSSSKVSTSVDMGSSTTPIVESTPVPITSSTAEFPTISQSLPSGVSTRVETTSTSLSSSKIPTETNKPGAHSSAARNGEGGFNMILLGLMATTVVNRLILNPLQNH